MKKILLFTLTLFLIRCAPDAPLKTSNAAITGKIVTLFGSAPLEDAIVKIFPSGREDTTNANGNFKFSSLDPGVYIVTVKKDMYIEKSETTNIYRNEVENIQFQLNGKPEIKNYSITSEHTNSNFPYPTNKYKVTFQVLFFDPDAFIADSVVAMCSSGKFTLNFQSSDSVGIYSKEFIYNDILTIDTLVGNPYHFWAKDLGGSYTDTVSTSLVRVIEELPDIVYPSCGDSFSIGDTLKWSPPTVVFNAFTLLKIWGVDQGINNPIWVSNTLSVTDTMFIFTKMIPTGVYEWAVEIVDNFGNVGRDIDWFNKN